MPPTNPTVELMLSAVKRIAVDLKDCHPKVVLLFGSMARYLNADLQNDLPNDLDMLVVTNNTPYLVVNRDYGVPVELHSFKIERMIGIARSLRYDSRAAALSKLYGRVLAREHAIDVIAAAMLLGPAYNQFGIQQIEVDGLTDTRDYSIHRVLTGDAWWQRLRRYACLRRGPLMRFTDKLAHNYAFEG